MTFYLPFYKVGILSAIISDILSDSLAFYLTCYLSLHRHYLLSDIFLWHCQGPESWRACDSVVLARKLAGGRRRKEEGTRRNTSLDKTLGTLTWQVGKYIQLHSIPRSFTGVKNAMAASMEFRSGTGSAS